MWCFRNTRPIDSFKNAYASDPVSAFGGVIACNYKVTKIAFEIEKILRSNIGQRL